MRQHPLGVLQNAIQDLIKVERAVERGGGIAEGFGEQTLLALASCSRLRSVMSRTTLTHPMRLPCSFSSCITLCSVGKTVPSLRFMANSSRKGRPFSSTSGTAAS